MMRAVTIREIQRASELYPSRLLDLPDAPQTIWVRGTIPGGPSVAIVGTRRASPDAITFTERIARELSDAGAIIVSGGAAGIDAAAHTGALAGYGKTVVVQAGSLQKPYPPANTALFARVLERGGGWLSETAPRQPTERWRFLARNRLIAALADVVVVVQAPARSGALSTARFARALGRPVLSVPGAPWDPRAEGVLGLIAEGASICTRSGDVSKLLGIPQVQLTLPPDGARQKGEAARVLDALGAGACHVDALVERTGLTAARVQVALIELSMTGRARQESGVWRAA